MSSLICCLFTDLDECATGSHDCQDNSICINLPGNYHCQCEPGYQYIDSVGCLGKPLFVFINLPVSYHCQCEPGYQYIDGVGCLGKGGWG